MLDEWTAGARKEEPDFPTPFRIEDEPDWPGDGAGEDEAKQPIEGNELREIGFVVPWSLTADASQAGLVVIPYTPAYFPAEDFEVRRVLRRVRGDRGDGRAEN